MLFSQYARKERPPQKPRRNQYAKFSKSQEFLSHPKQLTNKGEEEFACLDAVTQSDDSRRLPSLVDSFHSKHHNASTFTSKCHELSKSASSLLHCCNYDESTSLNDGGGGDSMRGRSKCLSFYPKSSVTDMTHSNQENVSNSIFYVSLNNQNNSISTSSTPTNKAVEHKKHEESSVVHGPWSRIHPARGSQPRPTIEGLGRENRPLGNQSTAQFSGRHFTYVA